jgi:hypothetical protein
MGGAEDRTMSERKILKLTFQGRVIDHLGIQMYQSPVAAVAELVANAWDADANTVQITLPERIDGAAEIVIKDDGAGMRFADCQERFLNVGYDRREGDPNQRSAKGRPVLGRKGIGKFAGFGIADRIEISTVSAETGEKVVFSLDIDRLRGHGEYVGTDVQDIEVLEYLEPDVERRREQGTTVRLQRLKASRRPAPKVFRRSMARRFLLHQRAADFRVLVDGEDLPEAEEAGNIEFEFPRNFADDERPDGLLVEDGWGTQEILGAGTVKWRVVFYESPIEEEELTGVTVFSHGKLAQAPFFFDLAGGLGGQHGQQYLSGQVEADYLDELSDDLIATERQRVNWEHDRAQPLLRWGQDLVRKLLRLWQERRAERKVQMLEEKLAPFSQRLDRLPKREARIVKRALTNIAKVASISNQQFEELGQSILVAWEGGRLKDLIDDLAGAEDLSEEELLSILVEGKVLTPLHTAEAVKARLLVIEGLRERIDERDLENAVRDHIAENPWLIAPEWETFTRERRVAGLLQEAMLEAGLDEASGVGGAGWTSRSPAGRNS